MVMRVLSTMTYHLTPMSLLKLVPSPFLGPIRAQPHPHPQTSTPFLSELLLCAIVYHAPHPELPFRSPN